MLNIRPISPPPPKETRSERRENLRTPPAAPPARAVAGRASAVGERNFAAGLLRFAVEKLADAMQAVTASQPPLSCPEINRVVRENAPVLVFSPAEQDFPAAPLDFIENAELREHRRLLPDRELEESGEIDPRQLAQLDDDRYYFLNLDNGDNRRLGRMPDADGRSGAPIHYQLDQGPPLRVTYHVFYAYNDGPSVQNHDGDWERITVEFRETVQGGERRYEPARVHFSAHHGGSSVSWEDAQKDENGRLLVYVAKGSHANYPVPGNQPTIYDADPDFNPRQVIPAPGDVFGQGFENLTDDETATDRNGDGLIDAGDGAVVFDTAQSPLLDVTAQAWYPEDGEGFYWGVRREIGDLSGPQGPSEEKGHVK
jgi:hypothetical protein